MGLAQQEGDREVKTSGEKWKDWMNYAAFVGVVMLAIAFVSLKLQQEDIQDSVERGIVATEQNHDAIIDNREALMERLDRLEKRIAADEAARSR